ncbi:MAG: hypothetical protein M3220_16995 [Chloroflexota bacterium]|nr:hypothetical protein [Chloroflexota bacterium]
MTATLPVLGGGFLVVQDVVIDDDILVLCDEMIAFLDGTLPVVRTAVSGFLLFA